MVVREGLKELNLPELMLYYPVHPVLSDKRWFDVVQPPRSHLEPPRTHVVLPCTPGSLRQTVVRCGSTTLARSPRRRASGCLMQLSCH